MIRNQFSFGMLAVFITYKVQYFCRGSSFLRPITFVSVKAIHLVDIRLIVSLSLATFMRHSERRHDRTVISSAGSTFPPWLRVFSLASLGKAT